MKKNLWPLIKSNLISSLIGIVPGIYFILIASGVVLVGDGAFSIPAWLLLLVGGVFILAGVSALGVGVFSFAFRNFLGALIISVFYILALWVSAGPGDRLFGLVNPVIGRIAFGVSTGLLFFMNVIAWRMILKSIRTYIICLVLLGSTFIVLGYWWLGQESTADTILPVLVNQKMNAHTEPIFSIEKIWDFPFTAPRAIATDSQGNIYVSETYKQIGDSSRILKFNSSGVLLGWWGKGEKISGWHDSTTDDVPAGIGRGPGEFVYIMKITFDNKGNMYVVDRGTYFDTADRPDSYSFDAIQRFNAEGQFTGMLYDQTSGWVSDYKPGSQADLSDLTCILVSEDDLLVGSYDDNRLNKFSLATGQLKEWFGKSVQGTYGWHAAEVLSTSAPYFGTEVGAFNGLIDCDKKGDRLYIVSYNSNPVVGIFSYKSGYYLDGLSHNDGHKPQEIIVDEAGNLVMSDNYEGSIKFFNNDLKQVDTLYLGPGGDYFAVGDFAFSQLKTVLFIEQQKQQLYELRVPYLK